GTVTSVLSLVTLSVSGSGRSGTAIVIGEIMGDGLGGALSEGFLMLLLSTAMGSALGYVLTLLSGRFMSGISDMVDPVRMNHAVVVFLLVLVPLLTGPYGLLVLLFSTVVGFLPNVCGVGRTVLCGCLMVPVILFL
ncbi:MAG: tripartite tricarboxylate transporter permease, partial [Candidatus Methanomethylophilaceae archaeon]|nr:tripartite tricarboxylate transporter permease [Candidatus Methanomethylophilaceae archaeon]